MSKGVATALAAKEYRSQRFKLEGDNLLRYIIGFMITFPKRKLQSSYRTFLDRLELIIIATRRKISCAR
jgi:hypothetical protein